jgi:hypothetical protein
MFLLSLDICLIGYAVFNVASYVFAGASREDAIVVALAQRLQHSSVDRLKAAAPQDLILGAAQVFDAGNASVDFAAEVQNQNAAWYATVKYNFQLGGPEKTTETKITFILPGEHKYLLALGVKNAELLSDATLNVIDVSWRRVNPHDITDPQEFIASHATFETTGAAFTPQGVITASTVEAIPGNQIVFDILNRTVFNFYEVPVQVLLMRGGSVQAIEYTTIKNFHTGEKRRVDLRNFVQGLTIDEVQVIPVVDVFDTTVYVSQ